MCSFLSAKMSNELFSKIKSDASFAEKIGSTKSIEEAFEVAKEAGIAISLSELEALNANPSVAELTDVELETVSGGVQENPTYGDKGSQCATCKGDDGCWK
jgi:predicted ribosomally synthesized peptide with nif11-like leader